MAPPTTAIIAPQAPSSGVIEQGAGTRAVATPAPRRAGSPPLSSWGPGPGGGRGGGGGGRGGAPRGGRPPPPPGRGGGGKGGGGRPPGPPPPPPPAAITVCGHSVSR